MKKGRRVLLSRDRAAVEKRFYDGYESGFLLNKASLLMSACTHPEPLRAFVIATGGNSDELDATVFQSYVSELHFTVLHQFEALFALIIAEFQPLPHWIFLTDYQTRELRNKVQAYMDQKYDLVTGGLCGNQFDLVARAVYPGVIPPREIEGAWRRSVTDIGWLIEEGAKRYLSSPEYNSYKHGLRVLPGSMTLTASLPKSEPVKIFSMPSSITYLEAEELEAGIGFSEVTKEVNADDAYQWVLAMSSIAEIIKTVRLALLRQVPIKVPVITIDRQGLSRLKPVTSFRMSL